MNKTALLTLMLAATTVAFADGNGNTATASTGAAITVVSPIKVSRVADLSFGSLVIDKKTFTQGVLTVGTDNLINVTKLGPGAWQFTGTGHQKAACAQFAVTGEEGYTFGFLAADFMVMHPEGSSLKISPMIGMVDTLTHGQIPATVKVGGSLILAGDPKPGVYSGTFSVMAAYL